MMHNAIVTGAARGIGRAIAEMLLQMPMNVCLVDLSSDDLSRTADQLRAKCIKMSSTARVVARDGDICKPDDVAAAVQSATAQLGAIDLLVNNAGTFSTIGPTWETDPERWFTDVKTNLYGTYLMTRAVLAGMVTRRAGRIITIVSSGGVGDPHPYSTSYAASKTGAMRFVEGVAAETADHGIRVFALAPPAVPTAMSRYIAEDPQGARWRPGFRAHLDDPEHTMTPSQIGAPVTELASGAYDRLSGRYIDARRGLSFYADNMDRILAEDLWTLRIVQ